MLQIKFEKKNKTNINNHGLINKTFVEIVIYIMEAYYNTL